MKFVTLLVCILSLASAKPRFSCYDCGDSDEISSMINIVRSLQDVEKPSKMVENPLKKIENPLEDVDDENNSATAMVKENKDDTKNEEGEISLFMPSEDLLNNAGVISELKAAKPDINTIADTKSLAQVIQLAIGQLIQTPAAASSTSSSHSSLTKKKKKNKGKRQSSEEDEIEDDDKSISHEDDNVSNESPEQNDNSDEDVFRGYRFYYD